MRLLTESYINGVYSIHFVEYTQNEIKKLYKEDLMELNTIELNEELKVIDGKAYAVIAKLGEKRLVNGCEARQFLTDKIKLLESQKKEKETEIATINTDLVAYKKLDNELAIAGYCKIDEPEYKKIDGIKIKDKSGSYIVIGTTHAETCTHKED